MPVLWRLAVPGPLVERKTSGKELIRIENLLLLLFPLHHSSRYKTVHANYKLTSTDLCVR